MVKATQFPPPQLTLEQMAGVRNGAGLGSPAIVDVEQHGSKVFAHH